MLNVTGRSRVWTALKGERQNRPPKGEIFVDAGWRAENGFVDLAAAIHDLQADLAVLPARPEGIDWPEWVRKNIFLFGQLQGPVTFFTERDGWPAFSRLLIKHPAETRQLIARQLEEAVQAALAVLDKGCDGIIICDDLAGERGLLINPVFLHTVYFPIMQQVLEQLGSKDIPVLFHSDGDIMKLIAALRSSGFWGIQGLQPSAGMGPDRFRQLNLSDWVFWGNFAFEGQGRLKTADEVRQDVTALLQSWADFPGFIFGSSGGLYQGLPLTEIRLAYRIVTG